MPQITLEEALQRISDHYYPRIESLGVRKNAAESELAEASTALDQLAQEQIQAIADTRAYYEALERVQQPPVLPE